MIFIVKSCNFNHRKRLTIGNSHIWSKIKWFDLCIDSIQSNSQQYNKCDECASKMAFIRINWMIHHANLSALRIDDRLCSINYFNGPATFLINHSVVRINNFDKFKLSHHFVNRSVASLHNIMWMFPQLMCEMFVNSVHQTKIKHLICLVIYVLLRCSFTMKTHDDNWFNIQLSLPMP